MSVELGNIRKFRGALLPAAGLVLLISGCLPSKQQNAMSPVSSASQLRGAGGVEGFRRTVYEYGRAHCATCHGVSQAPKFAVTDIQIAYDASQSLVNFVEVAASKFVKKVKDGHCGGACSTDGSAMVRLIEEWKAAIQAANGGGGDLPGGAIPKGNIFTHRIEVPAPNPSRCILPGDLRFSPDVTSGTGGGDNKCWTKLRFPVLQMSPVPQGGLSRAWFEVDFAYQSYATDSAPAAYVIRNPRLVSPDVAAYIFDIKLFINGEYRPQYGDAYRKVDTVVDVAKFGDGCTVPAAPTPFNPDSIGRACVPMVQPLFSTAASAGGIISEIVSETDRDEVSFSFEYLQKGVVGDCKDLPLFEANVFAPIKSGYVGCLDCHKSGGNISEAGQRFNMDYNDANNGATLTDRMKTICRRFLQRSNFGLYEASPIIVQPTQGLNGMPAQPNFSYYKPDWLAWIEREAKLAK